ncbi:MAG: pseudouridine-5'-phosphate glycosidase, partial [Anaerolineae bacterium]
MKDVAVALAEGAPVVALESALITHGFAPPANLDIARQMQAAVRE